MKGLLALVTALLVGCTTVDYEHPRTSTSFLPANEGAALDRFQTFTAGKPANVSGFYTLSDGVDAIAARLRLAEEAERSIDVQYYLIKRDRVGMAFLHSLLRAADRGVRVRLLLDDMFNAGFDADMAALNSHPNIEIRVFNPFNRGVLGRTAGAALNFSRINRRMHNKSFTLDSRVTIIGGRNIADEYFGAREDSSFGDLDVIGFGPIVQDVSEMFDEYWQHRTAVPLSGFLADLKDPVNALADLRRRFEENSAGLAGTAYADAVIRRAYQGVQAEVKDIRWTEYRLIYDTPDKGIKGKADRSQMITADLVDSLSQLERELVIISPYFVPTRSLLEGLIEARRQGVEIAVVTNSLAANNQKTVHGGYAPSRRPLLEAGVRLFEVRPDARVPGTEYVDGSAARSTLHTKSYVLDRREVFIGSFNFDPRSAYINTEMGVLINDPALGRDYVEGLYRALGEAVWEVTLDENGRLRWSGENGGDAVQYSREPRTSWWDRFLAGVYRLLPIRSQL